MFMKTYKILLIGLIISSYVLTSCRSEQRVDGANPTLEESVDIQSQAEESEDIESKVEEFVNLEPEIEESEPIVYLPSKIVPVMRAGAGFLGTIVSVRLEEVYSKDVSVGVAIYDGSEKVGYTIVTINKGELEGEEQTRLDAFADRFEDRIPSAVTLEITSVRESAF